MMAQLLDYSLLLFSIGAIIFMLITYLFITFNQFKVTGSQSISELKNELLKEKIVRYHQENEEKINLHKEQATQLQIRNIQVGILNVDFTLREIFKMI